MTATVKLEMSPQQTSLFIHDPIQVIQCALEVISVSNDSSGRWVASDIVIYKSKGHELEVTTKLQASTDPLLHTQCSDKGPSEEKE
jgi:hypothetical protein